MLVRPGPVLLRRLALGRWQVLLGPPSRYWRLRISVLRGVGAVLGLGLEPALAIMAGMAVVVLGPVLRPFSCQSWGPLIRERLPRYRGLWGQVLVPKSALVNSAYLAG